MNQITVLILTYNEAANIGRTIDALSAFSDIVILDSGSTDETLAICSRYDNVRVITRPFDNHAAQWNHGLTGCSMSREWVLALDADYSIPSALVDEIVKLDRSSSISGYRIGFRYCVFGRPLSGTLYPPSVVLYRRQKTHYVQDGHTQRPIVEGEIGTLGGRIDHDDRKPLSRWFDSQQKYAKLEVEHLINARSIALRWIDRLRLLGWGAPILIFFYTLVVKRCIFDGWPGWFYVLQRTLFEIMVALEIADRRLRSFAPR